MPAPPPARPSSIADLHPRLPEPWRALAATLETAAEAADAAGAVAPGTLDALRASGLTVAPLPSALGGGDLLTPARTAELVAVLRLLGAADLTMARLVEGHLNATDLVMRYGTEAQRHDFARALAAGALSGVWGADGVDPLTASPLAEGWRLTGAKVLASGAGLLARPVVMAKSEAGPLMLLPEFGPGERADISGWTAQGMRATATGRVDFAGLTLGSDQVLGHPGDALRQPWFSGGAWRFCAAHLGAAERLVDLFRAQLVARARGDDPYQLQRIAICAAAVASAAFFVEAAAARLAAPEPDPIAAVAFANLTRGVVERAALDVLEAVQRGTGLGGFLRPSPVERIARDLATYLRQPVPDLAMADAARAVLASERPTARLWEM